MSNSDTDGNKYFDEAERALSREREKSKRKKEEKRKIPPAYLLGGSIVVLVIMLAVQFLFSGEDEIVEHIIPQVVIQKFNGQLNALSQMVKSYEYQFGTLPSTEQEFLGYDDPVITYDRTSSHSYTLEYTFGDTTFVLEESIDTETDTGPIQPPGSSPENPPLDIQTPTLRGHTLP
ncbi:MAG: hypothetical protein GQ565_12025 [Candidatus Aegiribacteria sp.]|nr:hypothetical protein [Candidatus Aegiribacteria sp.]